MKATLQNLFNSAWKNVLTRNDWICTRYFSEVDGTGNAYQSDINPDFGCFIGQGLIDLGLMFPELAAIHEDIEKIVYFYNCSDKIREVLDGGTEIRVYLELQEIHDDFLNKYKEVDHKSEEGKQLVKNLLLDFAKKHNLEVGVQGES